MTDDLRKAIDTVKKRDVIGEKEIYIDRCDLDPRDIEILKRVWVKKQSRVKIAHEMHMSESSLFEHYRNAMLTLRRVILRDHPE